MKKISLIFVSLLLFTAPLHAAELFEGIVTFKMGALGKETEMKYFMRDSKMRMEIEMAPGMKSIGIADYENQKMYMLVPQARMYSEIPIDNEAIKSEAAKDMKSAEIIETGETEEILGYTAEKLVSKKGDEKTEIWIAKNFGDFHQADLSRDNPTLLALQKKFQAEKAFPFKIISYSADGKEMFRMQVTNVEKKPLAKELFTVPSDFKKLDLPSN